MLYLHLCEWEVITAVSASLPEPGPQGGYLRPSVLAYQDEQDPPGGLASGGSHCLEAGSVYHPDAPCSRASLRWRRRLFLHRTEQTVLVRYRVA